MFSISLLNELRSDNHIAGDWLLNYGRYQEEYLHNRQEVLFGSAQPDTTGGGKSNLPGNPTMAKAITLSKLMEQEQWLQVVEDVQRIVGEKKNIFLKIRREAVNVIKKSKKERGRPGWVVYVQHQYADALAKRFGSPSENFWLSESAIRALWQELINLAARIATKRRLL